METVSANDVRPADLERLDALVTALPPDSPLTLALQSMARSVRRGSDVVVAGQSDQLTPSQVARMLRMSRTHLYKVMDTGELPFVRVGRDRRVSVDDVFAFRVRRDQERRRLAERFAHAERDRAGAVAEFAGVPSDVSDDLGY